MTDNLLRELEARFLTTRRPEDGAKWLEEKVRVGEITIQQLSIAAACNDRSARYLIPMMQEYTFDEWYFTLEEEFPGLARKGILSATYHLLREVYHKGADDGDQLSDDFDRPLRYTFIRVGEAVLANQYSIVDEIDIKESLLPISASAQPGLNSDAYWLLRKLAQFAARDIDVEGIVTYLLAVENFARTYFKNMAPMETRIRGGVVQDIYEGKDTVAQLVEMQKTDRIDFGE